MKYLLFSAAILFIFNIGVFAQSAPEKDTQLWHETSVLFPIKKTDNKLTLFVSGTLRIGQNISRPVDERVSVGFDYKINDTFSYSSSYLYRAGQPVKNRSEYEHRLRFDFSAEKKFKNFSVKDRNRIEYRIRNSRSDSVRYRNKIQFKFPVKKDGKEIFSPFIADEPFYDFTAKAWTRNEFSVGVTKKFNKNFSADFFYMLQNNRGNSFKYVNIFGVYFKYTVD